MSTLQGNLVTNVKLLMGLNGVSQDKLSSILSVKQPQVSRRMREKANWTISDADRLAKHFRVPYAVLFDEPAAMFRYIADHFDDVRIDLVDSPSDQSGRTSTCNVATRPYAPRLFNPDGPEVVIDLRDHVVAYVDEKGPLALYANAS